MGIDNLNRSKAVFLDRDGVINHNVLNPDTQEWESPLFADQLTVIPGALQAMQRLQSAGYLLFVVSNQPNYAKGKATLETLEAIHARLLAFLRQAAVDISAFYYCLHHPDGIVPGYSGICDCRKPSPYFLHLARAAYSLELRESWMVGDRASDIECGRSAGVRTIRVISAEGLETSAQQFVVPDFVASGLFEAMEIIFDHS